MSRSPKSWWRHAAALLCSCALTAQCPRDVAPADGLPGTDGRVSAMVRWDPDGAGPLGERIVVGGSFTAVGNVAARNLAVFDPQTGAWSTLGGGCDGRVQAMVVLPNGDLVIGGGFTVAGTTVVSGIARWDGVAWRPFGSGMVELTTGAVVYALAVLPNGELVAGGNFSFAGGTIANGIARWDGSAWQGYLVGFALSRTVYSLAVLPDGSLVAGGFNVLSRWNGTFWEPLGSLSGIAYALVVTPGGTLIAGGMFTSSGQPRVAAWNGTTWTQVGPGLNSVVRALANGPGGTLLAGGDFQLAGGANARRVASWDGTSWSQVGPGLSDSVHTLLPTAGNTVWAGGDFQAEGLLGGNRLSRWTGSAWEAVGSGIDRAVRSVVALDGDEFAIAGPFTRIGSGAIQDVAVRTASGWQALPSPGGSVSRLFRTANGDLLAAVSLVSGQGQLLRLVANAWVPVGGSFNSGIEVVHERADGSLVVGGFFTQQGATPMARVAAWNGLAWQSLGSGFDGPVYALAQLPGGDLVAGGDFFTAGVQSARSIARWNGTAWLPLPGLTGRVLAMVVRPGGELIIGGELGPFSQPDNVRRWTGTSWQAMGTAFTGGVRALCLLPNGDLIAGGAFAQIGPLRVDRLARWSGTSWLPLASIGNGAVNALAQLPDGTLLVGGDFGLASGAATGPFVTIPTSCPAAVSSYGSGCAGAGGVQQLAGTTRPWLGSVFEAQATGLSSTAIGVGVFGFTPTSLQLWTLLPTGVPGCLLLATPQNLAVALPTNGSLRTTLAIPNSSALVGATITHQVLAIELGAGGSLGPVTSSNGLLLVIGAL
ncbi:MAG: hypothetical protein MUC36_22975 [Planctomycetes bacterium]|nr:hypothetical protein [Planctomycetota bacterium]